MKKVTKTFIAAVATLALSSSYAMAQSAADPNQTPGSGTTMDSTTMDTGTGQATGGSTMGSDMNQEQAGAAQTQSAEELKGMQVVSQSGEELGDIKEVRIDEQSGEVKFVTISRGGVLGIGGEEIPVPLEALQFDSQNERATLTVSEDKLDTAPQQANMTDEDFQRDLETHYGISPTWQQDSTDPTQDPTQSIDQTQPESDMQAPGAQDPTLDPQSGAGSQETQGTMEQPEGQNQPSN